MHLTRDTDVERKAQKDTQRQRERKEDGVMERKAKKGNTERKIHTVKHKDNGALEETEMRTHGGRTVET